jgi:hypothetical protein
MITLFNTYFKITYKDSRVKHVSLYDFLNRPEKYREDGMDVGYKLYEYDEDKRHFSEIKSSRKLL